MATTTMVPLDLAEGDQIRVRVYSRDRRNPHTEPVNVFEGMTTVHVSTLPYARRLGNRWLLTLDCVPGTEFAASDGRSCDYHNGDYSMEDGESGPLVFLLDRKDPERPYGPDGPTMREALEMSLATFEVAEGVEVAFD